jgi:phosphate transport system permease protein
MRRIEEQFFKVLMIIASTIIFGSLLLILWTIINRGFPALSWDMVTKIPEGGFYLGKEGGLLNAILGSIYLVIGASLLGLFVSIPVVIYINLYLPEKSFLASTTRLAADVLFGIPSIVYGAFAFTLMVYLGIKTSLLAGIIAVALLIIPILIRSMDEAARMVPRDLKEATMSLGATKFEFIRILLKQIAPGLTTAVLLSIGRAIGDAASVLFTTGYTDSVPGSLLQPAATLPLAIFFQLGSPVKQVQDRAYAAALILTGIVLALSLTARYFSRKFSKNKI